MKIQVSKLNPPTELRLHVGASIPKDKTKDSQTLCKFKKRTKTQVISAGVNPQRPNMLIRPPCYASHKH